MSQRQAAFAFTPTAADEAPGVTIRRAIGAERMAMLDPFLLLDHPIVDNGSEVVGFHRHPHRGIETLSYVLRGEVAHRDSLGNAGTVGVGGAQWMTAGNGIFHEEMLIAGGDGAEFLQLWFSLPRAQKRIRPAYHGATGEDVPEVEIEGGSVRIVAGSFRGTDGPFQGIAVHPTVLDVGLTAGASVTIPTASGEAAVAYVIRGAATIGRITANGPELIVLTDGESVEIVAGSEGARIFFVAAQPLNEPILQYRSFVMNTAEDIRETLAMIEAGTFGTE